MKNRQFLIINLETKIEHIYTFPFQYKGVTYCLDIFGNLIGIEQVFQSGQWDSEEIYMCDTSIFTVIEENKQQKILEPFRFSDTKRAIDEKNSKYGKL